MFDLVSKKLNAEEQVVYKKFCDFNMQNPIREGAKFEYANKLRESLGDKLTAFSLFEWHSITVYAYHVAENLIGILKNSGAEDKPKGDPMRETLTSLRVLISSLKKNEHKWLNNDGFEVNGKSVHGLLTAISTICGHGNGDFFDRIFELVDREVKPRVLNIAAKAYGVSPDVISDDRSSKIDLRMAMVRLIKFCSKNGNGFIIC